MINNIIILDICTSEGKVLTLCSSKFNHVGMFSNANICIVILFVVIQLDFIKTLMLFVNTFFVIFFAIAEK